MKKFLQIILSCFCNLVCKRGKLWRSREHCQYPCRTGSLDESVVTCGGTIEEVNLFCYIDDVLDGGGDANAETT